MPIHADSFHLVRQRRRRPQSAQTGPLACGEDFLYLFKAARSRGPLGRCVLTAGKRRGPGSADPPRRADSAEGRQPATGRKAKEMRSPRGQASRMAGDKERCGTLVTDAIPPTSTRAITRVKGETAGMMRNEECPP